MLCSVPVLPVPYFGLFYTELKIIVPHLRKVDLFLQLKLHNQPLAAGQHFCCIVLND